MNSVKVKRSELLDILHQNLQKHVAEFKESVTDYKDVVLKICQANLELAESGNLDNFEKIRSLPNAPVSYENSYKRAVRMLELSVDEVIELEEDVFNQLVLDEWDWKHHFSASNATYKSMVSGSFR